MLLFCSWLGAARKTSLTAEDIDVFESIVRPWQESVVRALRGVRDGMKPMPETAHDEVKELREQILSVELRAEQIEQALLFQAVSQRPGNEPTNSVDVAVRANLRMLLQVKTLGRDLDQDLSIESLIKAAVAIAA